MRLSLHSDAYTAEPVLPACDRTRCLASAVRRPGASKADHQQCDLVRPLPSRHPDHLHLADHLPFPAFNALSGCHPDQRFSEVRDQPSQRPSRRVATTTATSDDLPALAAGFVTRRPQWGDTDAGPRGRSEEHTSELQSLMRISYAVF